MKIEVIHTFEVQKADKIELSTKLSTLSTFVEGKNGGLHSKSKNASSVQNR